ncbi:MAG: glycoside hydrolase family 31, partial [Bacteroidia bacterium]|nr:glycoside hydrolase family 31 [Bacteroidia bacterium]
WGLQQPLFIFSGRRRRNCVYYFIHHEQLAEIIRSYTTLTGRIPLPPRWSLGFQQCRYSYYPESQVYNVAETFRARNIPADAIYLDIHYMNKFRVFTWNPEGFPDPAAMVKRLKKMGFRIVVIVDPGIKIEDGYWPYDEGNRQDVYARYPDGQRFEGEVWPGLCHFPDFTKPQTRLWWQQCLDSLTRLGIEGFWNDMNEPAIWGNSFPDLVEFDYDGHGATHKKVHNIYGLQMARSTYEGALNLLPNKRPFVLTRALLAAFNAMLPSGPATMCLAMKVCYSICA